jgi:hypothetical protein
LNVILSFFLIYLFFLADERREPYSSSPSFVREGLRTSVASSAASGESFSSVSASDTLDDSELSATTVNNKSRSASLSALGVSFSLILITSR